ncbi:MAG: hypothetical protein GY930_21595 [bacterium]|nr:hypothetical protein [bacterium]
MGIEVPGLTGAALVGREDGTQEGEQLAGDLGGQGAWILGAFGAIPEGAQMRTQDLLEGADLGLGAPDAG